METREAIRRAFDAIKEFRDEHRKHTDNLERRVAAIEGVIPHLKLMSASVLATLTGGTTILVYYVLRASGVV